MSFVSVSTPCHVIVTSLRVKLSGWENATEFIKQCNCFLSYAERIDDIKFDFFRLEYIIGALEFSVNPFCGNWATLVRLSSLPLYLFIFCFLPNYLKNFYY